MKVAFWTLGIFVIMLFGLILISIFGNITTTNQLNYTTMKNAVEASMNDSVNMSYYRSGFCVCTSKKMGSDKRWTFTSTDEYELSDIIYNKNKEECKSPTGKKECMILHGEYRINPQVFAESLTRRFVEMVNNNKDYQIIIQDVIEYPPKVSVRIVSEDDDLFYTDDTKDSYTIVNQIDSIVEVSNGLFNKVPTPTPSPTPKETPKITPTPKPVCCYNATTYQYQWEKSGVCTKAGYVIEDGTTEAGCQNACFCNSEMCDMYAIKNWSAMKEEWADWYPLVDSNKNYIGNKEYCVLPKPVCCYNKTSYQYQWENSGTCTMIGYEKADGVSQDKCTNVCYCHKDKNNNTCGIWALRDDDPDYVNYETVKDSLGNYIKDNNMCKKPEEIPQKPGDKENCNWHGHAYSVYCEILSQDCDITVEYKNTNQHFDMTVVKNNLLTQAKKQKACECTTKIWLPIFGEQTITLSPTSLKGDSEIHQIFDVMNRENSSIVYQRGVHARSAAEAKAKVAACSTNECVAICK